MAKKMYGLDMRGKNWLHRLASAPVYVSGDEGRIFYNESDDSLYFGNASQFTKIPDLTEVQAEVTYDNLNANGDVGTGSTQVAQGDHTHASANFLTGFFNRTEFGYVDADTITLESARYHHDGTVDQVVKWDTQVTFDFGPGGSNPNSSPVGTSEWQYLYIDDSALIGSDMTSGEFVNLTTAPTWTPTKLGWYNGNDRCIGAFWIDSSGDIEPFHHDGGDLIHWDADLTALHTGNPNNNWSTSVTLLVPSFTKKALVTFDSWGSGGGNSIHYWRQSGSSGAGFLVGRMRGAAGGDDPRTWSTNQIPVYGDETNKQIEIRSTENNGSANMDLYQNGYYLPKGL